jgi:LEA14-like dessication related protein
MVSRDGLARRLGLAVAVLVVALVAMLVIGSVLVAAGVIHVGAPRVTAMNTSWGQVTDDATEIETRVSVENPNPVGVPGVLDVRYRATMNDVVLAKGHKSGVGFRSGRSTLAIDATMQNDRIPDWWVTHVNGGERSELAITGTVSGPFGVSRTVNDTRTIETDLLSGFVSADRRAISMNGRDLLVLSNQSARWGEATAERTPIQFSAGVENRHEYPVSLDGIGYVVTMNEVTVGEGVTSEGFRVAPNETKRIAFAVALSTPRMADWWASHVRNDGRTNLSVSMYGVVDRDGQRQRVPVSLFDTGVQFETDLLGAGTTTATPIETPDPAGMTYERPSIERFDRRWGNVSDAVTEIRSTVVLENPNTGAMADLLELSVGERVTINGVEVAADETDVGSLDSGTNEIQHAVEMDNDAVPQWWAAHVNNGERSTVVVDPSVTADVGVTKFDVGVDDRESTVETDVLAGLTAGDARPLTLDGQRVGTVHEIRAEWGTATTDRTPVELTVRIENTAPVAITVSDLGYDVRMNDVVVGDGSAATEHRIPAGETRQVTFTIHLDSQSMDEWWVTHVRNGERTIIEYDATASVSARGRSTRIQVLSTTTTLETDFLGATGGAPRALVGDVFRPTAAVTSLPAE